MPGSELTAPVVAGETSGSEQKKKQELPDSGLSALALVAAYHQIVCEPAQVRHELGIGARASTAVDIVRAARQLKLKARLLRNQQPARIETMPLPAILEFKDDKFVLVGRRRPDGIYRVIDAATRDVEHIPAAEIVSRWNGSIILIARRAGLKEVVKNFGLSWFIPSIWRYRRPLLNVVAAALFIQLCGLITPFFFQITIDKVLTQKSYSTLTMVFVGLLIVSAFNATLQFLKTYILNHTTSRIDVELGTRLFDHLMRLPLGYFEVRPAGQTVARMRELDNVRSFLTGQGLTAALDIPFTLLFLIVLYLYSPTLAVIVTLSIPCYVLVALLLRPILRTK